MFLFAPFTQVALSWWFGLVVWGFESLAFVKGTWERPIQTTKPRGKLIYQQPLSGLHSPIRTANQDPLLSDH